MGKKRFNSRYVFSRIIVVFLIISILGIIIGLLASKFGFYLGLDNIGGNGLTGYSIFDNDPALIGYWNFDDGTAKELSGNGNDGVVNGATPIAEGGGGGAFSFDGIGDYVELGNGLNQNFSDGFSVSAWAFVKGGGAISNIIARANGTRGARPFQLYYSKKDGGKIVFVIKKDGSTSLVRSGNNFNPNVLNKWVHYVGVFKPREYVKLYINGEEIISDNSIMLALDNPPDLKTVIGADSLYGNNFNGLIDEAMIFKKALTSDEIKEIYDSQLSKVGGEPQNEDILDDTSVNESVIGNTTTQITGRTIETNITNNEGNMALGDEQRKVKDDITINEIEEVEGVDEEEQGKAGGEEITDEIEVQALECKFNRVYWSDLNGEEIEGAKNGERVFMNVESEGCNGRRVEFIIYESDGVLGRVEKSRFESLIENNFVRQEVVVNWECDGDVLGVCVLGEPDYVFVAQTNPTGESGILSVSQENVGVQLSPGEFVPPPNSPLALGQHPRLHIVAGNDLNIPRSIGYYREKIRKTKAEGGYKEEFQALVTNLDKKFGVGQEPTGAGGPDFFADYYALAALLGEIDGINYGQHTIDDYKNEAIRIMMQKIAEPLPEGYPMSGHNLHELFSVIARTYDWTYHELTQEQKERAENWLANVGFSLSNRRGGLSSSAYFGIVQRWYLGLAIYGEGVDIADSDCGVDSDNDGIPDSYDSDGGANDPRRCIDSDNDGCDDCSGERGFDPLRDGRDSDGDGLCEKCIDSNNDQKCTRDDICAVDNNGDGLCDEGDPVFSSPSSDRDYDGDGITNELDSDDDNDGDLDTTDCDDKNPSSSNLDREMCRDKKDNDCDGKIDSVHNPAQDLVDSFDSLMLNGGWLDAQNFVAREKGAPSEVGGYALEHIGRHIINIDAWKTATGIDYFSQGTDIADAYFMKYHSLFYVYMRMPGDPTYLIKWGQSSLGNTLRSSETLRWLGEALLKADTRMASLNKWMVEQPEVAVNTGNSQMFNLFFRIIYGDRTIDAKSPSELGLGLTEYFRGVGMIVMRSGFENKDDIAFVVGAPEYRYKGHTWATKGGGYKAASIPLGFTIDRFGGPLILVKKARHRACEASGCAYHNNMRFNDPALTDDVWGGFNDEDKADFLTIREAVPSSVAYKGGVIRLREFDDTRSYDYIFSDLRKNYLDDRVESYTRQYFYLRPNSLTGSDYVVVFDRVRTTKPEIIKRWVINSAYEPLVNGEKINVKEGKTRYDNANEITITNDLNGAVDPYSGKIYDAHGKIFVKKLLPQNAKIEVVGGIGHEFENDLEQNIGTGGDYGALGEFGAFYVGVYKTEVIASDSSPTENFLHVLQTADALNSAQSSSMVETRLIEASTGNMQGAFIEGNSITGQDNAVVMFAKERELLENTEQISYSFISNGKTRNLIADLPADSKYEIKDNGNAISSCEVFESGGCKVVDARTRNAIEVGDLPSGTLYFVSEGSGTHVITITPIGVEINYPPTVSISVSATNVQSGQPVQFTANAVDNYGSIVSYLWDFGDGTTGTGASVSHTYIVSRRAGSFTARVEVIDNKGARDSDSVLINVGLGTGICTDDDTDGYGTGTTRTGCRFVELDCDDTNVNINPGALEICGNGIDENCNGNNDDICVDSCGNGVIDIDNDEICDTNDFDGETCQSQGFVSGELRCVMTGEKKCQEIDTTGCSVIQTTPRAPSNLVVEKLEDRARLTWQDNSDNEEEFVIERSTDGITWSEIAQVPRNTISYEDIFERAISITGNAIRDFTRRIRGIFSFVFGGLGR